MFEHPIQFLDKTQYFQEPELPSKLVCFAIPRINLKSSESLEETDSLIEYDDEEQLDETIGNKKGIANTRFDIGIIYSDKGILVLEYIESTTLAAKDVRDKIDLIIPLLKKIHFEIPKKIFGQSLIFWVFHVIRNYEKFLKDHKSSYSNLLPDLLSQSARLEKNSSPYQIVFGHNDLLPANFLNDGLRLWIIDWEYAGFNTPLFDLGGLASNCDFSQKEEIYLLENYFEKKIDDKLLLQYNSLKCASLLRETMWSMVSELTSKIDFDYKNYTQENLLKFNQSYKNLNLS